MTDPTPILSLVPADPPAPAFDAATASSRVQTTVIEASAGTGKTTTIAALTVRALAEGWCPIDQVMLVTFGRRASSELRNRVYRRLAAEIESLEAVAQGSPARPLIADPVHHQLLAGTDQDRAERLERLRAAHAQFDRATIATTHQFCHTMLTELGVLADFDSDAGFIDDPSELIERVTDDVYLRMFASGDEIPLRPRLSRRLADLALQRPVPLVASDSDQAQLTLRFAQRLRTELEVSSWQIGRYGFDDMVQRLHTAVAGTDDRIDRSGLPPRIAAARQALSRRFSLVMIDEYQDTDTLQWQIVRAAFHGHSRVFLIGDPKQAIYAFRGADVAAYLVARTTADATTTLEGNWRTSPQLVTALDALFRHHGLGRGGIVVPPAVGLRPAAHCDRAGQPVPALELRLVLPSDRDRYASDQAERRVDADVVAETLRLLDGVTIHDDAAGPDRPGRELTAADITILVRTNKRGERLRRMLVARGVPAVFAGADSVLDSKATTDFIALFEAILQQTTRSVRRACLTDLIGLDIPELATTDEATLADLAVTIRSAGRTLERQGMAAMFEQLCAERQVVQRLLSSPGGERRLTDLQHLAELLHDEAEHHDRGAVGGHELQRTAHLLRWLEQQSDQRSSSANDERTRRLESDAAAVQIMTIHRAKGLSLPVVLLPDAASWPARGGRKGDPVVFHDETDREVLSVHATQAQHDARTTEDADEQLRLCYVAATRARYLLRMWWAPSPEAESSPLHRLLFSSPDGSRTPPQTIPASTDQVADLHRRWDRHFTVTAVSTTDKVPNHLAHGRIDPTQLRVRPWTRQIDQVWGRTSYSALTADSHVLPEYAPLLDDEPDLDDPAEHSPDPVLVGTDSPPGLTTPLIPLPGGTAFGTLVHAVLEQLDWTAADLTGELNRVVARVVIDHPVADVPASALVEGLDWVVRANLGEVVGNRSLTQIRLTDRLPELDFELPLAASSRASGTVGDLAAVWSDPALVGPQDPLFGYGEQLAASPAAERQLAGWLTGSIDAVLRWPGEDGQPRHTVVDYKTNRLATPGGRELVVADYSAQAMAEAMMAAHYPLQALIYSVALHRQLSLRLPGYDPQVHLGGVGYLFVRGMVPAELTDGHGRLPQDQQAAMPPGVFTWHPSVALIERASQILGGAR